MQNKENDYNKSLNGSPVDMESRLWDYIDGARQEAPLIERLIAENALWRATYEELLDVHSLMQAVELEEPSLRFTKNVMEEITRTQIAPATKKYINTKIIWGIAAFFATVIIGFLAYGFSQVDWSAAGSNSSPIGIDLGRVDYGKMLNNTFLNLFMMLNVVLGLFLLDRYLSMKRKRIPQGRPI